MKRSRRGGRRPQHGGGGGGGNNGGGGFNPNRTYDSSGPEIKIRGSASHVYEKYLQLARDANSSGDRIMAVGPAASVQVPAGAKRLSLAGYTLLPGFIDAHTHLTSIDNDGGDLAVLKETDAHGGIYATVNARKTLEAGFTTVREAGNASYVDVAIRDAINRGAWWEIFGDAQLNALAQQVDVSNQNVRVAEAKLRQAEGLVEQSRAGFFPSLIGNAGVTRSRTPSVSGASTASSAPANVYNLALNASWAPDLWGSVRSTVRLRSIRVGSTGKKNGIIAP